MASSRGSSSSSAATVAHGTEAGSPGATPGKGADSLRAENRRLFQEFVDFCSQHTAEHPEVMPYLASRHEKASPQFLASVEFRNVLGHCLARVRAKRSKVYVYINELCTVFKAHSQKRKLVPTSSAATAPEASTGPSEPQAEPPKPQGGSKRQIRYLENLLRVYAVEIRRLQERELDLEELDREDSTYLQESRLKRRMIRIFERLCELKDCSSLTGRVIEQRIPYRGTRYPEVNRRIERLINQPEAFPDYNDILKVVQKASNRHSLGLPKRQMENMAADAFREVGNRLQERRHLDLVYNFGCHLTDQYRPGSDPALVDGELARRLRNNRARGLDRLEQVVSHYAQLQDKGEEEELRRKRGLPPSGATSRQQGEPASPRPSATPGQQGRLSPRAARKEALEADEEEDEEEEEESSSESDLEAELGETQEGSGEDEEGDPVPGEEDPPVQEVEADQRLGPEVPEVILYSSTDDELEEDEEEEEENENEAAAAAAGGAEGAQPGGETPTHLYVQEVQETPPLQGNETPPPSPLPWTEEGSLPISLQKGPPPIKRTCWARENGTLWPADQTTLPEKPNGQPPRKQGRPDCRRLRSSLSGGSCIEVPSTGSSDEEDNNDRRRAPPSHSPAPVADSTWADSPGLALVSSSQGSPAAICKASVATQCDPEEIIILSDSD